MEIWKDIPDYLGYQASSLGRVKSLDRSIKYVNGRVYTYKGRILTQRFDKDGYLKVSLNKDNKSYSLRVHRVVALAFLPNPDNKEQVNHLDGVKTNNNLNNLEWCTNQENITHSWEEGLRGKNVRKGSEVTNSILKEEDIPEIRKLVSSGVTKYKVAKMYGVGFNTIAHIIKGNTWKHVN